MDDYEVIYGGPSAAAMILGGALILLLVGLCAVWIGQQPKPPAPSPAPPPAPPPPQKAPAPPSGVSAKVERTLTVMKTQIKTVGASSRPFQTDRTLSDDALDALVDPAAEHALDLIRDYEARVQDYAERCRRMIEK